MKRILLPFVALIILSLCGCNPLISQYKNSQKIDADNVDSIKIVQLDEISPNGIKYTTLAEVDNPNTFMKKLNKIECNINWGEPNVLECGFIVIKIEYRNGDYDFIYDNTQAKYRGDKNLTGYLCFDKQQFNELIAEYLNN